MNREVSAIIAQFPGVQFVDPAAQRLASEKARLRGPRPRLPYAVSIETDTLVRTDATGLRLRIYRSHGSPRGTLLWFHGGAYCIGSVEQEDSMCADLCCRTGLRVVSVDYRLAPEYPYPAGLDDCRKAVGWVAEGGAGHDPSTAIVVGGTSAGAGLAAAVALRCRDEDGPAISLQLLLYPFMDDRLSSPAIRSHETASVFGVKDARVAWRHYVGHLGPDVPVYAAPARAADLTGLPPAYVVAAGLDCVRDDALDYAVKLCRAGGSAELHLVPDVPHGFLSLARQAGVSQGILEEVQQAVATAVASQRRAARQYLTRAVNKTAEEE